MPAHTRISPEKERLIEAALSRNESVRSVARGLGVSPGTVTRALGRIAERTRTAGEFKAAATRIAPPTKRSGPYAWDLELIRAARDAQMRGQFSQPVRLAEAMRTDDALFVAYRNRVASLMAIGARLIPKGGTRGESVSRRASVSVIAARSVLSGIAGTLANHGIAIGYVEHEPSDDGTRIDLRLTEWPLEHVRWNESQGYLETRTKDGPYEIITHGDGRWVVVRKFGVSPWTHDAALLPGALLWASRAGGIKDWALASTAHGLSKMIGKLPPGVAIQGGVGGVLSAEAEGLLSTMVDLASGEQAAGIIAHGAEADFISNGSTAWQVFSEMINDRTKAAARIYLGTDAILGAVGGAPGVDIAALFAIATTVIQGDLRAVSEALRTGLYEPWTAINDGDSRYAPDVAFDLPDPDADAKAREQGEKRTRLLDLIKRMREEQMDVTQAVVNDLASKLGVDPPPQLAAGDTKATPLTLAPTDLAKVVRVGEARKSQGLPLFGDERDDMTITELDARAAQAAAPAPGGGATPPKALSAELAGTFEESKHPRADDGKFGSGGGGGGGGGSAAPGGDSDREEDADRASEAANDKVDRARERFDAVSADHDSAKSEHADAVDEYEAARANVLADPPRRAANIKKNAARASDLATEAEQRASAATDPAEADDLRGHAAELRSAAKLGQRADRYAGAVSDSVGAGKINRAEAAYSKLHDIDEDDLPSAIAQYETREQTAELEAKRQRGEISTRQYFEATRPVHDQAARKYRLADGNAPAFNPSELVDHRTAVATAEQRVVDTGRRLKGRERDLARAEKERDADGDGRTGSEEESDDESQPSADQE